MNLFHLSNIIIRITPVCPEIWVSTLKVRMNLYVHFKMQTAELNKRKHYLNLTDSGNFSAGARVRLGNEARSASLLMNIKL